jgi:RNA polymerase sigma-70 factor (ECF subfamily)
MSPVGFASPGHPGFAFVESVTAVSNYEGPPVFSAGDRLPISAWVPHARTRPAAGFAVAFGLRVAISITPYGNPGERVRTTFAFRSRATESAVMTGESRRGDRATTSDADHAMQRYAAGEEDAFAAVYDVVAPRLACYVRRQVRDPDLANDIVQQTFLHMHRARSTFVPGAAALPWAFAIARRLIIDAARAGRATGVRAAVDVEGLAATTDAEAILQSREAASLLAEELERLPPSQREAFALVKQQGLSLKEAARRLGTTAMAVKLRAHRALCSLRAALERDVRP